MPSIQNSTTSFIIGFEGKFHERKFCSSSDEKGLWSIGYGHVLGRVQKQSDPRQSYAGINLWTATLTPEQGEGLLQYDLTNIVAKEVNSANNAALTQDQYDAVISYWYNVSSKWKQGLIKLINKHKNNLSAGEQEIRKWWNEPITNSGGKIQPGLITRRKMEQDKFFGNLNGGGFEYYEGQTEEYGKGALDINNQGVDNVDVSSETDIEEINLEHDFEKIENHTRNLELETVDVLWGQRTNNLEDTDWIGLKQYILYLNTTYFQQHLVPFVELIPIYATDPPELTSNNTKAKYLNEIQDNKDLTDAEVARYKKYLDSDDKTLVDYRFERSASRLNDLSKKGGIDLLTVDPFQEVSDSFNKPNEAGKRIENERGFGYKLYGMITLNPRIIGEELSKAGAIGFKSLEVEMGAQTQNNMSLITVKILDVQGNKLLDVNSPWSFILNSRPGMIGGDFFFRFGWQLRVPKYDITKDSGDPEDENAKKFWNHPGWDLFGGKPIKQVVSNIASAAGDVITLTQSIAPTSFKSPGFKYQDENFIIERTFEKTAAWDKYILLTLINPELSINPEDGSVTATLYFRTNSVVANFLCPLLAAKFSAQLCNNAIVGASKSTSTLSDAVGAVLNLTSFSGLGNVISGSGFNGTTRVETKGYRTTLYSLVEAFLRDNNQWVQNNVSLTTVGKEALLKASDTVGVNSFLIVIGGQGKGSVQLDPSSIPIIISNELSGEINKTIENPDNNQLLLAWMNKVLQENGLTPLSAGDQRSVTDTTGTIVIYYDGDSAKESFKELNKDIALRKTGSNEVGGAALTTGRAAGNALAGKAPEIILADDLYNEGITDRLQMQDDVFSFRFKGSLVEGLSIEKLETPTLQKLMAQQKYAEGIVSNPSDITSQSDEQKKEQKKPEKTESGEVVEQLTQEDIDTIKAKAELTKTYRSSDNVVTYKDKKNALSILYASMLGASIKCIGHPWLKIGKNIGIKGAGFFDGKYLVTKLKHVIDEDNKFTTEINACRVLNQDDTRLKDNLLRKQKDLALNNPGTNYSSPAGKPLNGALNRNFQMPIDKTYVAPSLQVQTAQNINKYPNSNIAQLSTLNPKFRGVFEQFIRRVEAETPYKVYITSAWRSVSAQKAIAARNSVAAQGFSLHNFGLAIDINLMLNGQIVVKMKSNIWAWQATGVVNIALQLGLAWGGFFTRYDPVHFGLDGITYDNFTFRGSTCYARALSQFGSVNNIIWNRVQF